MGSISPKDNTREVWASSKTLGIGLASTNCSEVKPFDRVVFRCPCDAHSDCEQEEKRVHKLMRDGVFWNLY